MNTPDMSAEHQDVIVASPLGNLAEQSRAFAAHVYQDVAAQYLEFRRTYYHEEQPSLATVPPAQAEVRQAEIARLAENTLKLVPNALKSAPIVGGLLAHLHQVANIHSISERERTALHNMAMVFLHGTKDGIQPWYVEWVQATAHNLIGVTDPEYYMVYPWEALLYKNPSELATFDAVIARGDVRNIERSIEHFADHLVKVLANPIEVQPDLAFTGPDAERRRMLFNLKTSAALALGAYLVAEELRKLLKPTRSNTEPRSLIAPLPVEIAARIVPEERP